MTTLTLPMPPSLNNLFFNKAKGRGRSEKYEAWRDEAGFMLIIQRPPKIKGPVELHYIFEDGASKSDLDNRIKPLNDLLVTHKVIEADSPAIVRKINSCFGLGVKGVSVTVINLRPQEAASTELVEG